MFTPTVKLFYLEGSNPKDYELEVSVDTRTTSGLKMTDQSTIPNAPYVDNKYLVEVGLGTEETHVTTKRIPLGTLSLEAGDEIEVNLVSSSEIKGKGRVRAEEAQQESRPTEEF